MLSPITGNMKITIEYEQLPVQTDELRLIEIPPTNNTRALPDHEDVLDLGLKTYQRQDCPPYVALSYAWGPPTCTLPVFVNGRLCQISETVEQALRQLSSHENTNGNTCFVWIDQICINQDDSIEKNHQVQQMRLIYSEAERVMSWLGPGFPNSDLLFSHLQSIADAVLSHNLETLQSLHKDEKLVALMQEAFQRFCQCLYWKRLWILQEFATAPDVKVTCGALSLTARNLSLAMYPLSYLRNEFQTAGFKYDTLQNRLRMILYPEERSFVDNLITRRQRFREGVHDRFFRVLVTCLTLELDYNMVLASDPRDRILGLLHLASDCTELEELVDYSKTCEQVYTDTAVALLRQGNIAFLLYSQFPKELKSLPSWVPDWSMEVREASTRSPWFSKFCAAGEVPPPPVVYEPEGNRMSLRGVFVDKIVECRDAWEPRWLKPMDLEAARVYMNGIVELCHKSPRVEKGQERLQAARVATLDAVLFSSDGWSIGDYLNDFLYGYERLLGERERESTMIQDGVEVKIDYDTYDGQSSDWFLAALRRQHTRRPFRTASGFVGVGACSLEPGDEICIFFGGHTPFTVRPLEDGTYGFVGDAYVHGIMFGEFLKGETEEKVFTLR